MPTILDRRPYLELRDATAMIVVEHHQSCNLNLESLNNVRARATNWRRALPFNMSYLPETLAQDNNLYWCTASDHWEDCFVIANSKARAIQIFAEYNGYERKEVKAKLACKPPINRLRDHAFNEGLADDADILAYGGKIVLDSSPRVISFNGKMFREGTVEFPPGFPVNTSTEPWTDEQTREAINKAFPGPYPKPKNDSEA
jgi:hypothetical protein